MIAHDMSPSRGAVSLKNGQISGRVLNEHEMAFFRGTTYTYHAFNDSYLEALFLQQFWIYLSGLVSIWIAPCVLTCRRVVINTFTCLLHDSLDTSELPSWAFFAAAIGVFFSIERWTASMERLLLLTRILKLKECEFIDP
jgi:hypothetical protein